MDAGAVCGLSGVEGAAWGAVNAVGCRMGGRQGQRSRRQRCRTGLGGQTTRGGGRTASPYSVGSLAAWAHGWTASPYSMGNLTAWAHGLPASHCSTSGLTTRTCGLTASSGQWRKAQWNTGCQQWCRHGSRTGRVIL
jgi:hypothetical protein